MKGGNPDHRLSSLRIFSKWIYFQSPIIISVGILIHPSHFAISSLLQLWLELITKQERGTGLKMIHNDLVNIFIALHNIKSTDCGVVSQTKSVPFIPSNARISRWHQNHILNPNRSLFANPNSILNVHLI